MVDRVKDILAPPEEPEVEDGVTVAIPSRQGGTIEVFERQPRTKVRDILAPAETEEVRDILAAPGQPQPSGEVAAATTERPRTQVRVGDTPIIDVTPTVERFKAGVDLGTRGAQSLAQVPLLGRLMNLPATITEAITGEPSPAMRIEPQSILPEIPESVPPGMQRAVLEAGRAFLDPVVGAGATILGPLTSLMSPLAQVGEPVRELTRQALPEGTVGDVASETAAGLTEALMSAGVGGLAARGGRPLGRAIETLTSPAPDRPTVTVPAGRAPVIPETTVLDKVRGAVTPNFKRDVEFVSNKAELEGRKLLGQMQSTKQFEGLSKASKRIARETGQTPEDVSLEMGAALRGESARPEIEAVTRPIREQINDLQQQVKAEGLLPPEVVDQSIDRYLTRSYLSKISPDSFSPSDEVIEAGRDFLRRRMRIPTGEAGQFRRATEDEISGQVQKIISGSDDAYTIQGGGSTRINMGPFTPRKDIPKPIRALMGEIEEGPAAAGITISNLTRALASKRFLDKFAQGSEIIPAQGVNQRVPWVSDTLVPGYTQVTGRAWGPLDGKFVLNKYVDDLRGFTEAMSPNRNTLDGKMEGAIGMLMNFFKVNKTVLSPATHARNVLGNTMFSDYAGIPVWDPTNANYYAEAAANLLNSGKGITAKLARKIDGDGRTFEGITDVVREAIENGAIQTEFVGGEVFKQVADEFTRNSPQRAIMKIAQKPIKAVGRVYNAEDQIFKLASYIKQRRMGQDPRQAARHVNQWFPNYRDVSPAVQSLRSGFGQAAGGPFVTFFAEAARINAQAAKAHPIKFSKWMILPNAVGAAAAGALGLSKEQVRDLKSQVPSYLDQPMTTLWPSRDEDGNVQLFDMTFVHPLGSMVAAGRNGQMDIPLIGDLVLTNPIINTALEIANNQDFFLQRPIVEPGERPFEERLTKAFQNFLPSLTPRLPGITREGGTTAREIGRAFRREQGEVAPGRFGQSLPLKDVLVNELGPIRTIPVDPNLRLRGARELNFRLREAQRAIPRIAREISQGQLSREEGAAQMERVRAIIRDIIRQRTAR